MKTLTHIIAMIAIAFWSPTNVFAAEGVIAPDFTLATPDGREIRLADEVSEHTTVLLFWATWCPYCKALMPHLQSLRMKYGDDVQILAINFREDGDPVGYLEEVGYDFVLLSDGDRVAEQYGVYATPGVFVVDGEQKVRFNLYEVPRIEIPENDARPSHSRRAAYVAPHWAMAIKKAVDSVEAD